MIKKITVLFIAFIIFLSSFSAYIKIDAVEKTNSSLNIYNIFEIQYEIFNHAKRIVSNIGDIISSDMSRLLAENLNKKDLYISATDNIFYNSPKVSVPNSYFAYVFLNKNVKFYTNTNSELFFILFIILAFLIRYLGLLRLFYSNVNNNSILKAHKLILCAFLFWGQQHEL